MKLPPEVPRPVSECWLCAEGAREGRGAVGLPRSTSSFEAKNATFMSASPHEQHRPGPDPSPIEPSERGPGDSFEGRKRRVSVSNTPRKPLRAVTAPDLSQTSASCCDSHFRLNTGMQAPSRGLSRITVREVCL